MPSKPDRCPTCGRRHRRSNAQNRFLWLLYHKLSEKLHPQGRNYSAESFHLYYKSRFLGMTETVLPNGKTMLIPNSTADLDVAEFSDFYTKVEADAAERGVFLDELPT